MEAMGFRDVKLVLCQRACCYISAEHG